MKRWLLPLSMLVAILPATARDERYFGACDGTLWRFAGMEGVKIYRLTTVISVNRVRGEGRYASGRHIVSVPYDESNRRSMIKEMSRDAESVRDGRAWWIQEADEITFVREHGGHCYSVHPD
jgi:hypothetical protein